MGVILGEVLFDLLHHFQEVIEVYSFEILAFFVHLGITNLTQKLFGLIGISLKTYHNLLEIFNVDCAITLLIKQVEYLPQILDFFIAELHRLLLLHTILLVIHLVDASYRPWKFWLSLQLTVYISTLNGLISERHILLIDVIVLLLLIINHVWILLFLLQLLILLHLFFLLII